MKTLSEETKRKISATLKRKGICPPPGSHLGFHHSTEARRKISESHIGERNPMWKGDKIKIGGIHMWLRNVFGTPRWCEFCESMEKFSYDWALRAGYKYRRKREYFIRLCRGCHMKYDHANGMR